MNLLITGGAGYIGSHVAHELISQGHNLTILDDLSQGYKKTLPPQADFYQGDMADLELLKNIHLAQPIDGVFHFAAFISADESVLKPQAYYENNFEKSKILFDFCAQENIKNIVFSSTAAVYDGDLNEPVKESSPLRPSNPYGRSKLMTEFYLQDLKLAYPELNYSILRYFNVAGAKSDLSLGPYNPNAKHLIKIAVKTATNQRDHMEVFGTNYDTKDGSCVRDFIHIEDLVSAHIAAFDFMTKSQKSDIYNCGYEKGYSVLEVIETIKKLSGHDFKVIHSPRRAGDPVSVVANTEKIKSQLNWSPKNDNIEFICKNALDWEHKLIHDQ